MERMEVDGMAPWMTIFPLQTVVFHFPDEFRECASTLSRLFVWSSARTIQNPLPAMICNEMMSPAGIRRIPQSQCQGQRRTHTHTLRESERELARAHMQRMANRVI